MLNLAVIDCKASSVKLPNGNEVTVDKYVRQTVTYVPTNHSEVLKFYVLPEFTSFVLGGDWLVGNQVNISFGSYKLTF
jgi:hypothetical protein